MHAKITKWAWWAFTIAIIQHLILTANADIGSDNDLGSIEKRSDESKLEERFLEIKKFAYDTGSTPNKRTPIFRVSSMERFPNSYGAYFNPHPGYRRSIPSVTEVLAFLKKRAPISWGTGQSNSYFFGPGCSGNVCHRSLLSTGDLATSLVKRSPLPSNIEDPINFGIESNVASMRSTLDDLAEGMTMILLNKRFKFQFLPNFFRLFPGAHRRRQDFDLDDDFTNMLTKRWGVPWWMARFFSSGGGTRRQVLESDEDSKDLLVKRWGAPWYMRSNKDDKKMLFTERWIDDVESYEQAIEQVKRSPILKPLIMYWTMPMRRSLKDEAQIEKREPFWYHSFSYRPGNHRRSSKAEEEREVKLVKRSPVWGNMPSFFNGPPKRRTAEGTETVTTSEGILKKREEHLVEEKVKRELSSKVEEEREVQLVKRSPIWKGKKPYFSAPPIRRTSEGTETVTTSESIVKKREEHIVEENVKRELSSEQQFGENVKSNLIKREPVFRWNRNLFAPPSKKRQVGENANIAKRELVYGKATKYESGHERRQVEEPIKRDAVETQAEREEQLSKRLPIFRPSGNGYYKTQNGKNTKRNAKTVELNAIVKRAEKDEQLSKRTPIFRPKGTGYMGTQKTKNVK